MSSQDVTTSYETQTKDNNRFAPPSHLTFELEQNDPLLAEIESIPEKLNYKIGEVAELAKVKPYVLRYWESEFGALKPKKSNKNQRVYSRKDVELVMMIKRLLHKDRYSIEGAKSALKQLKQQSKKAQGIKTGHEKLELAKNLTQDLIIDLQKAIKSLHINR